MGEHNHGVGSLFPGLFHRFPHSLYGIGDFQILHQARVNHEHLLLTGPLTHKGNFYAFHFAHYIGKHSFRVGGNVGEARCLDEVFSALQAVVIVQMIACGGDVAVSQVHDLYFFLPSDER